jgi:hypothetical protein
VEIPQYRRRRNASGVFEELERKARFLALPRQKCAQKPNIKPNIAYQLRMPTAFSKPEDTE